MLAISRRPSGRDLMRSKMRTTLCGVL